MTGRPLVLLDKAVPEPQAGELLIKVLRCGVCRTDLHVIDGDLSEGKYPLVPGHEIVGRVVKGGARFAAGARVGVPWLGWTCGKCEYCASGRENLCGQARFTGYTLDGGYAEYALADERFCFPIPDGYPDLQAAPLLCAGLIGYRSLRLTNISDGDNLGLTGFGASAHLVLKMVQRQYPKTKVFVFSRTGAEQQFAKELGAAWAGSPEKESPEKLQAIIDTTPAWGPVVEALKNLERGGRLVMNAIRKEKNDKDALLALEYPRDLWMEKEIKSVANITRRDVEEFLRMAADTPIRPEVREYRLEEANTALLELKERKIRGAKVLRIG